MLPFLPRKVAQSLRSSSTSKNEIGIPSITSVTVDSSKQASAVPEDESKSQREGKGKAVQDKHEEEDYAFLVSLSLSDYALWSDPDLARAISIGDEECKCLYDCAIVD